MIGSAPVSRRCYAMNKRAIGVWVLFLLQHATGERREHLNEESTSEARTLRPTARTANDGTALHCPSSGRWGGRPPPLFLNRRLGQHISLSGA